MQLRASLKMVKLGYILSLLLALGIAVYLLAIHNQEDRMWALLGVPAILAVFAMIRNIRRMLTKLIVLDGRLRYESGLFSKTTHSIELVKVQDVRVDQRLGKRLLNIGDLSLESAGRDHRRLDLSHDRPLEAAQPLSRSSARHHPP